MNCKGCGQTLGVGDDCIKVGEAVVTREATAESTAMGNYVVFCSRDCLVNHNGPLAIA